MTDFFSDRFALRDNAFSRMDPRVKLLLAMGLLVCVVLSQHAVFPLTVLAACAVAAIAVETPLRLVIARLAAPAVMVCILVLLQSCLRGTTPLWALSLGAWKLTMTKEGLHAGLLCGVRVFSAVSVVFLLSLVTPVHKVFHALRWMRVPQDWLEIAILMYRYLFTLNDLASDITAAQKLRLGYQGSGRGLKSMAVMIGTLILRSIDQAMRTHEAMILRGYRGTIPFGSLPPLGRADWRLLSSAGILALGFFFVLERGLH